MHSPEITHIVIMGVSGAGKSTIAGQLSALLGWVTAEADEFHPASNIAKMSAGQALTDTDRWPWLKKIRAWLTEQSQAGQPAIVTCSALKRSYRDLLAAGPGQVWFVHLDGNANLIAQRMSGRQGHFMPVQLLTSQLDTLESLHHEENGIRVDISQTPEEIVAEISERLNLAP